MISADIVEKTWQEIGSLTVADAQSLGTRFAEEQPVALAYFQAALDASADFYISVRTILETYPEPEVLRYIVEALMEEVNDPDDPSIREECIGLAFIHLKTLLDAFVASLAR